jgi:hypothetical protein
MSDNVFKVPFNQLQTQVNEFRRNLPYFTEYLTMRATLYATAYKQLRKEGLSAFEAVSIVKHVVSGE